MQPWHTPRETREPVYVVWRRHDDPVREEVTIARFEITSGWVLDQLGTPIWPHNDGKRPIMVGILGKHSDLPEPKPIAQAPRGPEIIVDTRHGPMFARWKVRVGTTDGWATRTGYAIEPKTYRCTTRDMIGRFYLVNPESKCN